MDYVRKAQQFDQTIIEISRKPLWDFGGCSAFSCCFWRLKWMALEEALDNFKGYMLQQAGDSNNDAAARNSTVVEK